MKLTAKQHRNIANGIERIRRIVFCAFLQLDNHHKQTTGTYFSDRFKK